MSNTYNKIHIKTYDSLALEYKSNLKKAKSIKKITTALLFKYLKKDSNVLDIGCAAGYDSKMLSRRFYVTGIDISPKMVDISKKLNAKNRRVKIKEGDFLTMKFNQKFDGVFAHAFIHLFPTGIDIRIFNKLYKILNKGGVAYIATTPSKRMKEGFYIKSDYILKEKRFRKHWTKGNLQNILVDTGFNILEYMVMVDPFGKKWMVFLIQKP